jgi:hypothetical protein
MGLVIGVVVATVCVSSPVAAFTSVANQAFVIHITWFIIALSTILLGGSAVFHRMKYKTTQ